MNADFNERFNQLDQKIEMLTLELASDQREQLQQIGQGLSSLGQEICNALNGSDKR